jgi:hypothetical protein
MTKEQILEAGKAFYAWKPGQEREGLFRCFNSKSNQCMTETMCAARAAKPEIYRHSGCSGKCPRWKYYRKLAKKNQPKNDRLKRRAYYDSE